MVIGTSLFDMSLILILIDLFIRKPKWPLRDIKSFIKMLVKCVNYMSELVIELEKGQILFQNINVKIMIIL